MQSGAIDRRSVKVSLAERGHQNSAGIRKRRNNMLKSILSRGAVTALALAGLTTAAFAQLELKIMAPAAPGGGWDGTARSMQQALTASGIAKSVQVTNVTGAGGT